MGEHHRQAARERTLRAAQLLGSTVYDADGVVGGSVRDLVFTADRHPRTGEIVGYRLVALECGSVGLGHRLGYTRNSMAGPLPLRAVLRRLVRRSSLVPWHDVVAVSEDRVDTRLRVADFHQV